MSRFRNAYRRRLGWVPRTVRRVIILVFGGTILLIGLIMIIAPGPAFLVVPLGLAILALEFVWARRWLRRIKRTARTMSGRNNKNAPQKSGTGVPPVIESSASMAEDSMADVKESH